MQSDRLLAERVAAMPDETRGEILARMSDEAVRAFDRDWRQWRFDGHKEPPGDWRVWLMMAGRGFGKTRAGAEWVQRLARRSGRTRIALVAATIDEARAIMVEGASGILAIADPATRPIWEPSKARLKWRSGAQAFIYSGENPDGLRGPAHHYAWCDELAKWGRAKESWDNLMLGLREGERPRALVTTTPRPIALLKRLIDLPGVVLTRGRTTDNDTLPPAFIEAVTGDYGGTRLGRQELDGELIEDVEGALWRRELIERCRVPLFPSRLREGLGVGASGSAVIAGMGPPPAPPASGRGEEYARVVIGVDPPAGGAGSGGDACGIVVVALGRDPSTGSGQAAYVVEDASVSGRSPEGWARAVASAAARHDADRVIAEANNGGAMVESVLRAAEAGLPVKLVHASRGKVARAEPVAALYEKGRAFHAGAFPELEDELCGLVSGGGYEGPGRSPDRADALVWAMTELMLGKQIAPGVRIL